ncbi:TPA: relaxase/mobilization nuclease domain-containing protein [Listeria monocytogenes]
MAITKIWAIKKTLYLAIQYIINPNKTAYVHSHACAPPTADLEFELTLQQNSRSGGNNKAYHIIQSFKPDETTPKQAHEMGKQLLEQHLECKYEYVLSTHVDKGHIHNHIIFCASSFVDHKKYNDCKQSYYRLREASDAICAEHGLSVIEPTLNKGVSHYEWQMRNEGSSWKQELQKAIDSTIQTVNSYEDFLQKMSILGYEMKQGKHLAFRAKSQERFTRSKRLGEAYTEEKIKIRITQKELFQDEKRKKISSINQPVSLMIELENNKKVIENKGYEQWAKLHNLKQSAKTINLLKEQNINSVTELETLIIQTTSKLENLTQQVTKSEKEVARLNAVKKHLAIYNRTKDVYFSYQDAKNKAQFYEQHSSEIMLFRTANSHLKNFNVHPESLTISTLTEEIDIIKKANKSMQQSVKDTQTKLNQYKLLSKNLNITLESKTIQNDHLNKER